MILVGTVNDIKLYEIIALTIYTKFYSNEIK